MIKEIIFILILIVAILIAVASNPVQYTDRSYTDRSHDKQSKVNYPLQVKKKKNTRVRFSPEKKERTYNVKTGQIIGDSIAPVEDIELNE